MDKLLLLIMAASGLSAVSSAAGLQYYFVYDRKNFTEAQRYCREKHTDLVTVDSMEVMKILTNTADLDNMFYSNNSYRAWIGLYNDHVLGSWRWSLSDPSFYKPGETEFRRWAAGRPNAGDSGKICTGMGSNGLWYDDSCDNSRYPLCADIKGSNVTFVIVINILTWTAAQSYCRAHYTDLASVRNMTENQKVQAMLSGGGLFWIGLFRDTWKWSDGSTSSFSFWKNGQPDNKNKTCVSADFSQSGAWEGWSCDMERAFICYGPVVTTSKKVLKVKFENKKNLDLNDPAVMEAMLKQLKQKLRAQGLDHNIKLSWRKQADGKVFHKEDKKTNKRRRKREEL
ncbi:secretory phospholipase A2 receptor-like [Perca fluviatilis]|uniref:secretory phospholipase A2 receptor-like n=1 Tax=Perca fluviatilis TaxID=8168 RepID=UPI001964CAC5|nr:secretory phospholipase A2 receptor-like [Perca fluviatilis]